MRLPIVPDAPGKLKSVVRQALTEHDIVVINAGSSAGSEDFTAGVVQELGELIAQRS